MTTVVADKHGMASDSQMSEGEIKSSVTKFWRIRGWLVGGAGDYNDIVRAVAELQRNRKITPVQVFSEVEMRLKDCDIIMLSPKGGLYVSENGGNCMQIQDGFYAIGSGRQGAMVAMFLGCSPKEAVDAVKKVDPNTGGRTITRKL